MDWYEQSVDFHDDPKCVALQSRLKNPLAECWVSRVYAYCYRLGQDRFTGAAAVATIERAAGWRGKTGALVTALIAERFIDQEGDVLIIHAVGRRLEAAIRRREEATQRKRDWREKNKSDPSNGSSGNAPGHTGQDGDVTGTPRGSHTSVLGTRPDQTRPDLKKQQQLPAIAVFRRALADELCITGADPLPLRNGAAAELLEHIARLGGPEAAAAECAGVCRERGKVPGSLDYIAKLITDIETPPPERGPDECPKPSDPDFNDPGAWPSQQAYFDRDGPPIA